MDGRLRWTVVLLAAMAVPVPGAGAPPRIAVAPVRGDASGALTGQVRSLLCADWECVPYSKVRTGGKLDFAKVEALKVTGVLVGTLSTSRKEGKALELALLKRSLHPAWKGRYLLGKGGKLPRDSAAELSSDVRAQLGGARPPPAEPPAPPAPPPTPVAPPPAAPAPLAEPAPSPPAPAPAPEAAAEQPAPSPRSTPATAAAGAPPPGQRPPAPPVAAVEAGISLMQRKLSYQGEPAGSALRGLEANLIASPRFRLDLFPLALATQGALAGIGLFGDYAFSVGLTTKDPSGGADHSTSASRLQLGLLWRLQPVAESSFALIPAVSYQSLKFTVGGTPITGLPDSDLSGIKAGLDAEIPIGGAVAILLGAGYVKWSTARELVSDAFFPSGSAYAIEAEAGVSVGLGGAFTLRVLGDYSSTQYSLEPTGASYQATGATDRYLGGRATVRAQF